MDRALPPIHARHVASLMYDYRVNPLVESVGIIIPACNAERFIERTLDSVRRQTRMPEEIVVVDDGSSDRTANRVEAWAQRHGMQINLIRQANCGASSARNTAIEAVSTDLVATLDADDVIVPRHVATLMRGFQIEPDLILCFGDASAHGESGMLRESYLQGSKIAQMEYVLKDGLRIIRQSAYEGIVCGSRMATCSTMFRRQAAIQAGLYDVQQGQCNDTEFLLRLSRLGKFGYFDEVISEVQRHSTNLTHPRHRVANRRFRLRMLYKMLANREQFGLTPGEIDATHKAIDKAAAALLYNASDRGFRTYARASVELLRMGLMHPLTSPKDFARSLRRL